MIEPSKAWRDAVKLSDEDNRVIEDFRGALGSRPISDYHTDENIKFARNMTEMRRRQIEREEAAEALRQIHWAIISALKIPEICEWLNDKLITINERWGR